MPTVLRSGPYRFYFYSHEPSEPPHIHHIDRDDLSAKFWLDPVQLARNFGFRAHELRTIQSIVMENAAVRNWRESFLLLNEDVVRILSRNAPELEREQHLVGTFDFVFSL